MIPANHHTGDADRCYIVNNAQHIVPSAGNSQFIDAAAADQLIHADGKSCVGGVSATVNKERGNGGHIVTLGVHQHFVQPLIIMIHHDPGVKDYHHVRFALRHGFVDAGVDAAAIRPGNPIPVNILGTFLPRGDDHAMHGMSVPAF